MLEARIRMQDDHPSEFRGAVPELFHELVKALEELKRQHQAGHNHHHHHHSKREVNQGQTLPSQGGKTEGVHDPEIL